MRRLTANRQWTYQLDVESNKKATIYLLFLKKCHLIILIYKLVSWSSRSAIKLWNEKNGETEHFAQYPVVWWRESIKSSGFYLQESRCHSVARQMVGKICPSDGYAMKSDSQCVVQGLMLVPQYKSPLCCCAVVLTITLWWCAPTGRQSVYLLPHGMRLAFRSPWSSPLRLHPNTILAVQI